ncbi:large conductance mechanosensitive channel protein MscL [Vagococcus jeotgali]|uniref:large conductance mechanosensitive channel protein MscL n=1 Tax=Vagococcus jeotgali TaxID=3109030 RepID=UPI002DD94113|nr:large conductance mechanosensitive channel protein MscL [Vagococcus sp. B2T-5]
MVKEFKTFIARGNLIDMAIGIIIGAAFTTLVNSVVEGLITPVIGLVISLIFPGAETVDEATKNLVFIVNGVEFNYGQVISAIITFFITALVLFFIVKFLNKAEDLVGKKEEEAPSEHKETTEDVLKDIRSLLQAQQETVKDIKEEVEPPKTNN